MSVRRASISVLLGVVLAGASLPGDAAGVAGSPTAARLEQAFQVLHSAEFIDLTHDFGPDSPHWKGFVPETVTTLYTVAKDGFHA